LKKPNVKLPVAKEAAESVTKPIENVAVAKTEQQLAEEAADKLLPNEMSVTVDTVKKAVERNGNADHIIDYWKTKGYNHEIHPDGSIKLFKQNPTATVVDIQSPNMEVTDHAGMHVIDKKMSNAREAYNLSRGLLTGLDISAPGRQGLPLIFRKEYWTSLKPMIQAGRSEEAFKAIQDSITSNPAYKLAKESGLYLSDLTNSREEAIMSTWAEKVPGIRASNRAYTSFLNKLRFDSFNSLTNDYAKAGIDITTNVPKAKALAEFINTATGRGSLKAGSVDLERNAQLLNDVLFSPRLISSRVKMYNNTLNPVHYWNADPVMRKESLRSLLGTVIPGTLLGQLARMSGAEIESNPTNPDFGKIKIGETRIDPFAGFQQYAVAASKLASGQATSPSSGETYDLSDSNPTTPTYWDVVENFGISKAHPVAGFLVAMLRGREATGDEIKLPESIIRRYIPIILQDLYDISQEDPELLPIALPAAAIGMGTQTFRPQ
jgi:hypothetical protein